MLNVIILICGAAIVLAIPVMAIVWFVSSVRKGVRREGRGHKLLHMLCAAAASAILFRIGMLAFGLTGNAGEMSVACSAMLLADLWAALRIFGGWKRKAARRSFYALLLCGLMAAGGLFALRAWEDRLLRIDDTQYSLYEYIPYGEDSKCAVLDEPSDFTLTGALRLDGATALYPVYSAFARAVFPEGVLDDTSPYAWDNEVRCTTTADAYDALVEGDIDLIFVAGASDAQAEYARSKGEEMVFTPIGRDAFVFFVNARNPVESLTVEQLRGIYSGKITDWKAVGGAAGAIRAFQRDEGSGSQTQLQRFMGGTPLMKAPVQDVVDGMGGIFRQVAAYTNYRTAIGYSFRFYAEEMVPDDQIKLLAVNGVEPTAENIANGSYPLGGEFYAVHLCSNENPEIDAFIEWMLSAQGQELVEKTGYVPLNP